MLDLCLRVRAASDLYKEASSLDRRKIWSLFPYGFQNISTHMFWRFPLIWTSWTRGCLSGGRTSAEWWRVPRFRSVLQPYVKYLNAFQEWPPELQSISLRAWQWDHDKCICGGWWMRPPLLLRRLHGSSDHQQEASWFCSRFFPDKREFVLGLLGHQALAFLDCNRCCINKELNRTEAWIAWGELPVEPASAMSSGCIHEVVRCWPVHN